MNKRVNIKPPISNRLERLNYEAEQLETRHNKVNTWFTWVMVSLLCVSVGYFLFDLL